jgi:hypothetical protein
MLALLVRGLFRSAEIDSITVYYLHLGFFPLVPAIQDSTFSHRVNLRVAFELLSEVSSVYQTAPTSEPMKNSIIPSPKIVNAIDPRA